MSQSAYIDKVLATFLMEKAIGKSTPMELGTKTSITDYDGIATKTKIKTYQSMIGSLMLSRPNVSRSLRTSTTSRMFPACHIFRKQRLPSISLKVPLLLKSQNASIVETRNDYCLGCLPFLYKRRLS